MTQEHWEPEKDPNYQAYLRLKEKEKLPEGRYLAIAEGELVTSGDEVEKVIHNTAGIDVSVMIIDTERELDDTTVHMRSPRLVRD